MKQCSKCGVTKQFNDFHRDKSRKDGFTSACRICRTHHVVEYHKNNQTWKAESSKQYNKRRMQTEEAKQKAIHASMKWQKENLHKSVPYNRANASMKRVSKKYPEAMNCCIEDILSFYEEAFSLEQKTGCRHHVDHKVPLVAGGRHEPSNLEVLSETDHKEKTKREFMLMRHLMTRYYSEETKE